MEELVVSAHEFESFSKWYRYREPVVSGCVQGVSSTRNIQNAQTSRFYQLVLKLLGTPIGRAFDVSSLEGISGRAVITHNASESGDVYANVTEIVDVDRDDEGAL